MKKVEITKTLFNYKYKNNRPFLIKIINKIFNIELSEKELETLSKGNCRINNFEFTIIKGSGQFMIENYDNELIVHGISAESCKDARNAYLAQYIPPIIKKIKSISCTRSYLHLFNDTDKQVSDSIIRDIKIARVFFDEIKFHFNFSLEVKKKIGMSYSLEALEKDLRISTSQNKGNIGPIFSIEQDKIIYNYKAFGANNMSSENILNFMSKKNYNNLPIYVYIFDGKQEKKNNIKTTASKIRAMYPDVVIGDEKLVAYKTEINYINEKEEIRNQAKFISNLLETKPLKMCAFCDIDNTHIIQGAHLLAVQNIKKMTISIEEKKKLATDADNGMWLCNNHHKLLDSKQIIFDENTRIFKASDKKIDEYTKRYSIKLTEKQELFLTQNQQYGTIN